jgi:hypothetical protein
VIFYVNVLNRKFVDNFLIFLVLKFQDFRTIDLRVIDFKKFLSGFVCILDSSEMSCFFTIIAVESPLGDN